MPLLTVAGAAEYLPAPALEKDVVAGLELPHERRPFRAERGDVVSDGDAGLLRRRSLRAADGDRARDAAGRDARVAHAVLAPVEHDPDRRAAVAPRREDRARLGVVVRRVGHRV